MEDREELINRITTQLFAEFPRWMRRIANLMRSGGEELTRVDVEVLMWLKKHGPVSLSELSILTDVKKPNLSNVVSRLRSQGFVRQLEGKGRSHLLELTPEGEAAMCKSRDMAKELFAAALTRLSDSELENMLILLEKMEGIVSLITEEQSKED